MRYSVVLIWDEEGQVWVAEVPAMDGAATSGETVEEALAMARELIEGRILVHQDFDEPVPVETVPAQVHSVEVAPEFVTLQSQETASTGLQQGEPLQARQFRCARR